MSTLIMTIDSDNEEKGKAKEVSVQKEGEK